ncbi:hypothetical protein PSV08DRAFT_380835 [Bipolaris maydis]|nr:hypothetical protein PSV08DRAFT_380835 [Bipolaris maydis]
MAAVAVPPADRSYRWAHITDDDQSGVLYIVTFLSFTYTSLTFLTRIFIKWRMLGLDDAAMLLAQVADLIQFSLLLLSLSAGLAKSFGTLTDEQYSRMAWAYSSNQVVVYICLGLSKLSTILLVQRLFTREMRNAWKTCVFITGIIVIWTIASALLVSIGCPADALSPRTSSQICNGIESRYLFVTATDGLTDFVLALTPTYLIRNLQMSISFKLQVLGVFGLRLHLLVLTTLFFLSWRKAMHSENPGVERVGALELQQCQVCASLLTSTIPCLKSFIQSFDTGSGVKPGFGYSSKSSGKYGHDYTICHSASQSARHEVYDMLVLMTTRTGGSISPESRHEREGIVRAEERLSIVEEDAVTGNKSIDLERRSSQRSTEQLFIRKDVEWTVKNEPARTDAAVYVPGKLRLPK